MPKTIKHALFLGCIAIGASTAHASLSWDGDWQPHVASMHSSQSEQYCVQSHTSDIGSTRLADFIEQTLEHNPGKQWDGLAGGNINFKRTIYNCNHYAADVRATIEVEYHVAYGWSQCDGSYYSCTVHTNPQWDPVGNHTHYVWGVVYFQAPHVIGFDSRAQNFINHETGHILGLTDPDGYGTDCQESVMRNSLYGCSQYSYVTYPTKLDKAAVTRVANHQN